MRKVLFLGLVLVLAIGCKKFRAKPSAPAPTASGQPAAPTPTPAPAGQPAVHAPTGVVLGSSGGGSGGAAQAVRKAVVRTVNQNEMNNLRLFMDTASSASGQMPTREQVLAAIGREAPKTAKLIQDGDIVLTGTRTRENIWAYTAKPQTVGGEHLIVTATGIERMATPVLQQRLQQQQGR